MRTLVHKTQTASTTVELSRYGSRSLVSGSRIPWTILQQIAVNAKHTSAYQDQANRNGNTQETIRQYDKSITECVGLYAVRCSSLLRYVDDGDAYYRTNISTWDFVDDSGEGEQFVLDDGIIQLLYEVKQQDSREMMNQLTLHDESYHKNLTVPTSKIVLRELFIRLHVAHDSLMIVHRKPLL
jgi:hypothetical protein